MGRCKECAFIVESRVIGFPDLCKKQTQPFGYFCTQDNHSGFTPKTAEGTEQQLQPDTCGAGEANVTPPAPRRANRGGPTMSEKKGFEVSEEEGE